MRVFEFIRFYIGLVFVVTVTGLYGQGTATMKTLTVSDGIPQSYISGIVQDPQGFVWIASRDGLAKYDGRKFSIFRHEPENPGSVSDNIINNLHMDTAGDLWITYEQGDIDVLDTNTGKITHFSALKNNLLIRRGVKSGRSMVHAGNNRYWLLGSNGDIYITDFASKEVEVYPHVTLLPGLKESFITGMALSGDDMLLVTGSALVYMDKNRKIKKVVKYTFSVEGLYNPVRKHKDNSPLIRKNGEVVIYDENRLIIYNPLKDIFSVIQLPWERYYVVAPRIMDQAGNILFAHGGSIYKLDTANHLTVLFSETNDKRIRQISLLLDRSGVLWAGTNGFGIKQYDLYLKQMPQRGYKGVFQEDMLRLLGAEDKELSKTFLWGMVPYFFRWTDGKDGKIWFSKAGADVVKSPNVGFYDKGGISIPSWKYSRDSNGDNYGIDALALSASGKLWGIDHAFRPVLFDRQKFIATVSKGIPHPFNPDKPNEINGFTIDGEDEFWISSSQGLLKYNLVTGKTQHFFNEKVSVRLMALLQDPKNPDILWLGSSSEGLIRFNKKTSVFKSYTIKDGLPNAMVYAIVPDNHGKLWCSTNRGVFSFDPVTGRNRTYTTQGDLAVDEFNRFHFFKFPDGQMVFGSTEGFTVFHPNDLVEDSYQPDIALTGIKINNRPSDAGEPDAFLKQSINNVGELTLPYDKNFLAFEFAALQFNIPKKLQYRYRLTGLDHEWVMAGTDNTATYTTIPPGKYTLEINASNTAGIWSKHIKSLRIVITPPFWGTWWFRISCVLIAAGILYFIIKNKIDDIRKKDQEKISYERKSMELEAQALRAQMNPHFIFNCLNSIKALIQEDEKKNAVQYLTTFSKLIRRQLYNTQREISLYDELETCKLYLKLEALRFGDKITYEFAIDGLIDLHRIMVPPLILQPFVENAIIHGILPLERTGHILIKAWQDEDHVVCCVDDNGIGREKANQDKALRNQGHISKGTLLAEDRLKIHNHLNHNNFDIQITDKKDADNQPAGTCVTLLLKSTL